MCVEAAQRFVENEVVVGAHLWVQCRHCSAHISRGSRGWSISWDIPDMHASSLWPETPGNEFYQGAFPAPLPPRSRLRPGMVQISVKSSNTGDSRVQPAVTWSKQGSAQDSRAETYKNTSPNKNNKNIRENITSRLPNIHERNHRCGHESSDKR